MLEFFGILLLIVMAIALFGLWVAYRIFRRVVGFARGLASMAPTGSARQLRSALPDPRWSRMSAMLDRGQREAARRAREQIHAFVTEAREAPLDPHARQLLIGCETRVPEMIDVCIERCRSARPDEKCDYATATLERLVAIGDEAEAARRNLRVHGDSRLDTMHRYFDSIAGKRGV